MIIFVSAITSRFRYIAGFIEKEIRAGNFKLTDDRDEYLNSPDIKINYSDGPLADQEILIRPQALLFETGINPLPVTCFEINNNTAFFKTGGDFPFDIFAASFYLLSRYEEYLPHNKDSYGRYAHQNSLAFRENFLHLPLVNIWLRDFEKFLRAKFSDRIKDSSPGIRNPTTFLPTYDIDEAFSYQHKPFWKNAAGFVRSLFKGDWKMAGERLKVLSGKMKDPYDAYQWMDQLHQRFHLKPYYFFILAGKNARYDKNINPRKKGMRDLLKHHYYRYPLGLHPSWQSGDDRTLLTREKETLEEMTGGKIVSSRQHYIRLSLPETYRLLSEAGILFDFSMGYGSINGFRASVASPFYWYDLQKEMQAPLLLYPFCYMDANSFFEQNNTSQEACAEMKQLYKTVRESGGTMISIWHNNFLGTAEQYQGWREAYEQFITDITV